MKEVDVYSFDGKDYLLITKIKSYLYLSNEKNPHDMMIRKEDPNDPNVLLPLEDDDEFEQALLLLTRKKLMEEEES